MKKCFLSLVTAGLVSISAFGMAMTADAAGNKLTHGELTYNDYGGWIEITSCNTSAVSVEIPNKIDGKTVRDIGANAFSGCSALTQITIPDCVENIKDSAFKGCKALTTIDLPERLATIGFNAFGESGLTEITIPEAVNSIDRFAFSQTPITTIAIPKNVETIGDRVFYDCSNLTEITVDEGNASFISNDGVLFSYDQSELLCYPAAKEDTSYTMPETVTTLYSGAFYGCENLVNVTVSENVTVFPEWTFYYCRGLKEITIPESVTKLDTGACYGCINLISVFLSNNITNISVNAFGQCNSLTDVYYAGTEEEWKAIDIDDTMGMNDTLINANIHYNYNGITEQIKGDVNADGVFSVADVILLQKWLLTVPDTHLANWKAADFCEDGKLDVFDLCLMKRDLLDRNKSKLSENSYDFQLLDRYARSNHQGQTNVITQDDEALIIWEIPCFTELIGDVMEVISIDSCTFKEYDGTTGEIKIIQSEDKYNFDNKGYSYCIVKALSPGDATLELACKSGSRYVDFVIDDKLNITLKDDKKIYRY